MPLPPAPPRFQPFSPSKPVTRYHRKLPHWRQEGATYFVTFHTQDSLPRTALDDLIRKRDEWLRLHPSPRSDEHLKELSRLISLRTEYWLHQGHGTCPFNHLEHRERMHKALLHFHGTEEQRDRGEDKRVELGAFVAMPNHAHIVVRPFEGIDLEDWLGSVKQFVSKRTPQKFKPNGNLWFRESHDRMIRDLKHLNNLAGISSEASHLLWIQYLRIFFADPTGKKPVSRHRQEDGDTQSLRLRNGSLASIGRPP